MKDFRNPQLNPSRQHEIFQVKTKSTQREEILDKGVSDTAILSFYFSLFVLFPYPLTSTQPQEAIN